MCNIGGLPFWGKLLRFFDSCSLNFSRDDKSRISLSSFSSILNGRLTVGCSLPNRLGVSVYCPLSVLYAQRVAFWWVECKRLTQRTTSATS